MATTTQITLTATYQALNTVENEYIIQAKGNKRVYIKFAAVLPVDQTVDDTIELEPGQGITSDMMVGLAFGKVNEGEGSVSVTE